MKSSFRISFTLSRWAEIVFVLLCCGFHGSASADFAEFPQSGEILSSELEYRTSGLATCHAKARCAFFRTYAGYLTERVRTLEDSADPLAYLSKYPKETESRIRDYRDSIEYEFDTRFAAGLDEWQGRNASGTDGNPYEEYATYDALPKLLREYRTARDPYEKAATEVGIRYLLSDATLLSRQCAE